MLGSVPLKSSCKSLDNWYSDIPIGSLELSVAYFARILSFVLQINKPIVVVSFSAFNIWFTEVI